MKKKSVEARVIPPFAPYIGRADLVFVCVKSPWTGWRYHLAFVRGDEDHWVETAPTPCDGLGCRDIELPKNVAAELGRADRARRKQGR